MNPPLEIFEQHNIQYDWKTLYAGLILERIEERAIVDYAVDYLTAHPDTNNPHIIELAWGGEEIDYEKLLALITGRSWTYDRSVESDEWSIESRKWRFGVLVTLSMEDQEESDLLEKVAGVYADFHYPEEMEPFIHYLPPSQDTGSLSDSIERPVSGLMDEFRRFLRSEQQYLQNGGTH
ncbi:DUF2247 family protein [Rossellomorea marisflavi]|uniref:DUF2247 family protein n=1 Tax=Rossellomorea marisflavi TaxID=189381 RepID=UPI00064FB3A3|nr:DUF2247 family protein [Rossellomorea marisflavi]KML31510.1 hypothetical protein VL12_17385 [Rossellomorea marisflavi]